MGKALTHIALHVYDIERSTAFYKEWCGMDVVHSRASEDGSEVRWLASPGQEENFVIVLIPGGPPQGHALPGNDITHLGFAVESETELKDIFRKAQQAGKIYWNYQTHDYPVGSLFSIRDPDGHVIEFSYGQPLGDFKDRNSKPQGPQNG